MGGRPRKGVNLISYGKVIYVVKLRWEFSVGIDLRSSNCGSHYGQQHINEGVCHCAD